MEKEIRLTDIACMEDVLNRKPFIVSLGHEGCIKKLPTEAEIISIAKYNRVKILLPKIGNGESEYIENYVKKTAMHSMEPLEVTVNDFGTLYRLKSMDSVKIIIGRLITKSFEAHPQADFICKRYPEEWKQNLMQSCIIDDEKIKLFQEYNVKGVEVELLKYTSQALDFLKNKLEIHGIAGNSLLAVFRSCPFQNSNIKSSGSCNERCQKYAVTRYGDRKDLEQKVDFKALSGILDGNVFIRPNNAEIRKKVTRIIEVYPALKQID